MVQDMIDPVAHNPFIDVNSFFCSHCLIVCGVEVLADLLLIKISSLELTFDR